MQLQRYWVASVVYTDGELNVRDLCDFNPSYDPTLIQLADSFAMLLSAAAPTRSEFP